MVCILARIINTTLDELYILAKTGQQRACYRPDNVRHSNLEVIELVKKSSKINTLLSLFVSMTEDGSSQIRWPGSTAPQPTACWARTRSDAGRAS